MSDCDDDFQPPNRLRKFINAPGGVTMKDAVRRAGVHMEMVHSEVVNTLNQSLAGIEAQTAEGAPPPKDARDDIHAKSCTIAALGGMFGRMGLSKAAHSLCALIDETDPQWDSGAVAVHVRAMRLLNAPEAVPHEAQVHLVRGLDKVRKRLAPPGVSGPAPG